MKIRNINAIQIYDSRGNPTIEVELELENGVKGYGLVPSGASTGQYEALELRDSDPQKFRGMSVFKAINNVNTEIAAYLKGKEVEDQESIDEGLIALDGTANKSRLGANAILGVSLATADAAARCEGKQLYEYLGKSEGNLLPLPEIQIIGGGAHANWRIDVQDFLLIATGAQTYEEVMEITFNVHRAAADILKRDNNYFGVADEGGFWPNFEKNKDALDLMIGAIKLAGYTPGNEASISLDIAASDLYSEEDNLYHFNLENRAFTSEEFAILMTNWCHQYPIISIEDPMADNDWKGWELFANLTNKNLQIIGDDLFTTNIERIRKGIERGVANSVLIKPNQIGTLTETMHAISVTQDAGWLPIISARSGETEDAIITHLAVATNAGQLKVGSFVRSERMAKWNEVLRIQRNLKGKARFVGSGIYKSVFDWHCGLYGI